MSSPRPGGHPAKEFYGLGEVKVLNAFDTMTCAEFDLDAVKTFTKRWFADPRSRTGE